MGTSYLRAQQSGPMASPAAAACAGQNPSPRLHSPPASASPCICILGCAAERDVYFERERPGYRSGMRISGRRSFFPTRRNVILGTTPAAQVRS